MSVRSRPIGCSRKRLSGALLLLSLVVFAPTEVASAAAGSPTFTQLTTEIDAGSVGASSAGGAVQLVVGGSGPKSIYTLYLVKKAAAPTTGSVLETGTASAMGLAPNGFYVTWAKGGFLSGKSNCRFSPTADIWVASTKSNSTPVKLRVPSPPHGYVMDGVPDLVVSDTGAVAAVADYARPVSMGGCNANLDGSPTNLLTMLHASPGSKRLVSSASNRGRRGVFQAIYSKPYDQYWSGGPTSAIALCTARSVTIARDAGRALDIRTHGLTFLGGQSPGPAACSISQTGEVTVEENRWPHATLMAQFGPGSSRTVEEPPAANYTNLVPNPRGTELLLDEFNGGNSAPSASTFDQVVNWSTRRTVPAPAKTVAPEGINLFGWLDDTDVLGSSRTSSDQTLVLLNTASQRWTSLHLRLPASPYPPVACPLANGRWLIALYGETGFYDYVRHAYLVTQKGAAIIKLPSARIGDVSCPSGGGLVDLLIGGIVYSTSATSLTTVDWTLQKGAS